MESVVSPHGGKETKQKSGYPARQNSCVTALCSAFFADFSTKSIMSWVETSHGVLPLHKQLRETVKHGLSCILRQIFVFLHLKVLFVKLRAHPSSPLAFLTGRCQLVPLPGPLSLSLCIQEVSPPYRIPVHSMLIFLQTTI